MVSELQIASQRHFHFLSNYFLVPGNIFVFFSISATSVRRRDKKETRIRHKKCKYLVIHFSFFRLWRDSLIRAQCFCRHSDSVAISYPDVGLYGPSGRLDLSTWFRFFWQFPVTQFQYLVEIGKEGKKKKEKRRNTKWVWTIQSSFQWLSWVWIPKPAALRA